MRNICVNVNNIKGKLDKFFFACVGAGRAGEVMRYIPQKQLDELLRAAPFEYIRFHGLFHEETGIASRGEDGELRFSFLYTDMLLDTLLEKNVRPVVELGLMPDCMAKDAEYVFWWKMNKSMPKSISEWRALIFEFARHVTERYGEDEVRRWYFEVWNEPNHHGFFTEYKNINAYFELYDAAAEALKSVCKDYRVGGPATAGMVWIDEMISHCKSSGVPIDFISSHSYGIKGDFDPDGRAIVYLPGVDKVSNEIRAWGQKCHENGLELIITEWSSSFSSTDGIHDSYYNAAYILHNIKRSEGYADMMSYWTYTDIFEENGIPTAPFHGGFGLMTLNSVKKPSYYAYEFLGKLGDIELSCEDADAYACKSEDGVQVLFWNVSLPSTQRTDNREYFGKNPAPRALEDASVCVSGLAPRAEYEISVETIGYKKGDAYGEYLSLGAPKNLSVEQTTRIKLAAVPKTNGYTARSDGSGNIILNIEQYENQVDMITLKRR